MVMTHETVWVCTDCLMVLANGETGGEPDQPPLQLLDGLEVTLGMVREEHDCTDAEGRTAHDRGEECECERTEFSWSPCEGCGSRLGGSRDAATVWRPE